MSNKKYKRFKEQKINEKIKREHWNHTQQQSKKKKIK